MNLIEKSKQCKKHCKEQIKVLRKQLGVNSKAEIEKFDFFKDLPRVKLSEFESRIHNRIITVLYKTNLSSKVENHPSLAS